MYQIVRQMIGSRNEVAPKSACQVSTRFACDQLSGLYTATGDSVRKSSRPAAIAITS